MSQKVHGAPKGSGGATSHDLPGVLQRKCACGGSAGVADQCDACRHERLTLQRRRTAETAPTTVPPIVHDVLRSPGRPLDPSTRTFMESRFGHDFSRLRIHTDARAAASALTLSALAYAVGTNLVFAPGQYAPETAAGRRLLAHELTHVLQQESGRIRQSQGTPDPVVGPLDAEADRVAQLVTRGSRIGSISPAPAGILQRQRGEGDTYWIPAFLSDEDLVAEYWLVLKTSDPSKRGYLKALDAEIRRRVLQRTAGGPPPSLSILGTLPTVGPAAESLGGGVATGGGAATAVEVTIVETMKATARAAPTAGAAPAAGMTVGELLTLIGVGGLLLLMAFIPGTPRPKTEEEEEPPTGPATGAAPGQRQAPAETLAETLIEELQPDTRVECGPGTILQEESSNWRIGTAVHNIVQEHYLSEHPIMDVGSYIFVDRIPSGEIYTMLGGPVPGLGLADLDPVVFGALTRGPIQSSSGASRILGSRPDVLDAQLRTIYEIKPRTQLVVAYQKVIDELDALNTFATHDGQRGPWTPGPWRPLDFTLPAAGSVGPCYVEFKVPFPGVIIYSIWCCKPSGLGGPAALTAP